MDFHCGNSSLGSFPHFPCMKSAVCLFDESIGEYCDCPDGWRHDFLGYGHFYNCSLPVGLTYYLFIVSSVVFGIGFFIFGRDLIGAEFRQRRLKVIRSCQYACSFCAYFNIVSVFLQDGFFEGAIITFLFTIITGFLSMSLTVTVLFKPVAQRVGNSSINSWINRVPLMFCLVHFLVLSATLFSALRFARDPNPRMYNSLIIAATYENVASSIFFGIANSLIASKLKGLIPKPSNNPAQPNQVTRPDYSALHKELSIIITFHLILISFSTGLLILTILWQALSSFPFLWIMWLLLNIALLAQLYLPLFHPSRSRNRIIHGATTNSPTNDNPVLLRDNDSLSKEVTHVEEPQSASITTSIAGSPTFLKRGLSLGLKPKHKKKALTSRMRKLMSRISEQTEENSNTPQTYVEG
jgi:hypothetical protein